MLHVKLYYICQSIGNEAPHGRSPQTDHIQSRPWTEELHFTSQSAGNNPFSEDLDQQLCTHRVLQEWLVHYRHPISLHLSHRAATHWGLFTCHWDALIRTKCQFLHDNNVTFLAVELDYIGTAQRRLGRLTLLTILRNWGLAPLI